MNSAINRRHTDLVVKDAWGGLNRNIEGYQQYLNHGPKFIEKSKELLSELNDLVELQKKEIEEIRALGKHNEKAVLFIDQKIDENRKESFIIIQDRFFGLTRVELVSPTK